MKDISENILKTRLPGDDQNNYSDSPKESCQGKLLKLIYASRNKRYNGRDSIKK